MVCAIALCARSQQVVFAADDARLRVTPTAADLSGDAALGECGVTVLLWGDGVACGEGEGETVCDEHRFASQPSRVQASS